jgi:enamine deaminase RidA (YjgF/YER057c/UK114 family)
MMTSSSLPRIGFTCAYTPVALIHAAGFTPYRILPMTEALDQAGTHLHDNLCPHVKKILDRAVEGDMLELGGAVIMESCDTMRRLADAWRSVRPEDRLVTVDLPMAQTESAILYFARELEKLGRILSSAYPCWFSRVTVRYARSDNNPYSNAVLVGDTLYLAGSIGLDPETGRPPESVEKEVRIVMDGMKRRLEMVGMTMDDVVSVQVFCPDLSLYQQFNDAYRTYFEEGQFPARAFIGSGPLLAEGHFEVMATAVKR